MIFEMWIFQITNGQAIYDEIGRLLPTVKTLKPLNTEYEFETKTYNGYRYEFEIYKPPLLVHKLYSSI